MRTAFFAIAALVVCTLTFAARAQSGACCNTSTGACTLSTAGAACCAAGTTYQGDGSVCNPNPCGGACCTPATGACATSVAGSCTGTFVPGGVCTPSPCGQGACCNNATGACTATLAGGCTGLFLGAGTVCSPNPCPRGACCNPTTGACTTTLLAGCTAPNVFQGAGSTCTGTNPCGGSCCNLTTGACTTTLSEASCTGAFVAGGVCSPNPCVGACCSNTTGACTNSPVGGCAAGTSYQGAGTTCAPSPCPGACCTGGVCAMTTSEACTGTYQGNGTSCTPTSCSAPCCLPSGACSMTTLLECASSGGTFLIGDGACPAGSCFGETEPNDSRDGANPVPLASGGVIAGLSMGQGTDGSITSTDRYMIQHAAAPLGIYRHKLDIASSTPGQRYQLRGDFQFNSRFSSPDTFITFQIAAASGNAAVNTLGWYSFGKSEIADLVVNGGSGGIFGGAVTPGPYKLTLTTTPVTPIDIGTFPGGMITVSTVGVAQTSATPPVPNDTDLWVFDSQFNAIPGFGNDDKPNPVSHTITPGDLQSVASKDVLEPGVYYLALTDYNLAVNQLSPVGDRYPSKSYVARTPGIVTGMNISNSPANVNVGFKLIDGDGVEHTFPNTTKVNSYDVVWVKFTLTAPAAGACCKPDGSCLVASDRGCTGLNSGVYRGDGSACDAVTCASPATGACCQVDGTCTVTPAHLCTAYPGAWGGAGSACTPSCRRTLATYTSLVGSGLGGAGGAFVDVTAGPSPIRVTRFDYFGTMSYNNCQPANRPDIDVYVRQGTYVGHEIGDCNFQNPPPHGWVLHSTRLTDPYPVGSSYEPLPVELSAPVEIAAGQTVGFYLMVRSAGMRLSSANGFVFQNADLTLTSSSARSLPVQNVPGWAGNLLADNQAFTGRVFYNVAPPPCRADFNASGAVDVSDIFAFLSAWFSNAPGSDFNASGATDVADIFAFLSAWFAGCP